jgi:hypothetical protein
MFARLPAVIFYPALLLWSLVYGALAGAFFKLLAVYENWLAINRYHIRLWKKYPRRSYQKYISAIWASEIRGVPAELADYSRQRIEKNHPSEPFPVLRIFANTLFMLLVTPLMVLTGLFLGPHHVFVRGIEARRQVLQRGKP